MNDPDGRYANLSTLIHVDAAGKDVRYLERRFITPPTGAELARVAVMAGDRDDLLSARHLGASTAFWRIADSNTVMQAEDIADQVGRRLSIHMPEAGT